MDGLQNFALFHDFGMVKEEKFYFILIVLRKDYSNWVFVKT